MTARNRETSKCLENWGPPASSPSTPQFTLNAPGQGPHDSLIAEGRIQGKTCRVNIDTGSSVTIARPDIFTGQPARKPSRDYVLQTASGETIPVLKESFVELTLGRWALRIWVFVAKVTDDFIFGMDVLRVYDASVDIRRHLLRLGREELTLWRPGTHPKSARFSLVGDEVIPARCERVVMAKLGAPLGATNVLIEPSQKRPQDGVFIARTLVRAGPEVPVRVMNVTDQDQVLGGGTILGHGQPAIWAATIDKQ